jgi:7-cyano-7-deazaguanine synthase
VKRSRLVFLLSGGMDSMVAVDLLRTESRLLLLPLFVNYGQPAASREGSAAKAFCRLRGLRLARVPIPGYTALARPRGKGIPRFLPGRNLLLLVVAGLVARAKKARFVGIGAITDQTFSDTAESFFKAFNGIAPMAFDHEVSVMSPFVHSSKVAVADIGRRLGTPLHLSYSCYVGRSRPCGRCGGCRLRAKVLL